jgi:outer membrane protein assembly factor BamB
VVFFCDDDGSLAAADARTGKRLWSFQASHVWKASPNDLSLSTANNMLAVAIGQSVISFGYPLAVSGSAPKIALGTQAISDNIGGFRI